MFRRALLLLAVALALIAVGGAAFTSPEFSNCEQHQGRYPTKENNENEKARVLVPAPNAARVLWACVGGYTNANGSAITAIATVCLTLVTFLLGYLVWDQGRTSRAQLRAYLATVPRVMEFVSQTDAGTRVRIAVDIKNVGKTPARSVQIRWNQSLLPHPMTKERKFEWNSDDVVAEGVVYPEGEHSSVKSFTIKPGDIDRLRARDGTVALYVYGMVTYLDAFKRRQKSEFCAFITGDKWDVWRAAARAAEDRRALAGFTFAPFNNT